MAMQPLDIQKTRFALKMRGYDPTEVADRLAASPGTKDYGALTVFVRAAFDCRKVRSVSPGCFHPQPDVTSAVVELSAPIGRPRIEETEIFRAVVRGAFAARRKTLRNAWRALGDDVAAAAEEAGVSLDARGETLSVEAFARVAEGLTRRGSRPAP